MLSVNPWARFAVIPAMAFMLLYSSVYAQTSGPSIETDAPNYRTGDMVTVSGDVGGTVTGEPLLIQVFNPNGAAYRFDQVEVAADGSYAYEFRVGGPLGVAGTYRVVATYDGTSAETTFEFASAPGESEVIIDGKTYKIRHHRGSVPAWVGGVTADPDNNTLIFELSNTGEETFEVELDKTLIDTENECFTVMIDDVEAEAECSPVDNDTVLLTVQVPAGSNTLIITGSYLIPEFGTVAIMVLAGVVAMTIFATRRASIFRDRL